MFRVSASARCIAAFAVVQAAALTGVAVHAQTTPPDVRVPELRVFDPSLVDKSLDPCDNFYKYSCNGWFKRNPLPADQTSYGRFTELYELNRLHLKQILEQAAAPSAVLPASEHPRSANEQKIGDDYASCMDTAAIDKLGIAPLRPELDRIAALKSNAQLPALLAHLHSIGVNAFFGMGSNPDFASGSPASINILRTCAAYCCRCSTLLASVRV